MERLDEIYNLLRDTLGLQVNLILDIKAELVKLNDRAPKKKVKREVLLEDGMPRIAQIWNKWAHECFARVTEVDPASRRYTNALERWKRQPREEYWVGIIRRINASKFCRGESPPKVAGQRPWKMDFEFLVRPDTPAKILEGKYDDEKEKLPEPRIHGYIQNPETGELEPVLSR